MFKRYIFFKDKNYAIKIKKHCLVQWSAQVDCVMLKLGQPNIFNFILIFRFGSNFSRIIKFYLLMNSKTKNFFPFNNYLFFFKPLYCYFDQNEGKGKHKLLKERRFCHIYILCLNC